MNRFALQWHHNVAKWQGFGRSLTGQNSRKSCIDSVVHKNEIMDVILP